MGGVDFTGICGAVLSCKDLHHLGEKSEFHHVLSGY